MVHSIKYNSFISVLLAEQLVPIPPKAKNNIDDFKGTVIIVN